VSFCGAGGVGPPTVWQEDSRGGNPANWQMVRSFLARVSAVASALIAWTLLFGRGAGVKGHDRCAAASRP
jgi:hypothetical protein